MRARGRNPGVLTLERNPIRGQERDFRAPLIPMNALSLTASLLLLAPLANAQSSRDFSTERLTDLGTFKVATQSWVSSQSSFLGVTQSQSIYDNTCLPRTVGGMPEVNRVTLTNNTEILASAGQIPSLSNVVMPGSSNAYEVNGWRWAFCPDEPSQAGLTMEATIFFLESMASCGSGGTPAAGALVQPTASIQVFNLPPNITNGGCVVFDVDLSGSGLEFVLQGDGDGAFNGPLAGSTLDTFGIAMTMVRSDGQPFLGVNGFGVGGDPGFNADSFGCQDQFGFPGPGGFIGDSTVFQNPGRHVDGSTGFGTDDWLESVNGTGPTCFFLGLGYGGSTPAQPNPWASLHCEIYGEAADSPMPIIDQCNGDGGDQMGCTNCPCMNEAAPGTIGGCLNSAGTAARLVASGSNSVGAGDLRLEITGAPPFAFALLVSGAGIAPANVANPCFGMNSGIQSMLFDGLRCALMTFRHGGRTVQPDGTVGVTNGGWGPPNGPAFGMGGLAGHGGFVPGQVRHFQALTRDFPDQVCMRGLNTTQTVTVQFGL